MATTTSYEGRTVDLEAFQTVPHPSGTVRLSSTVSSNDVSRRIAGIQKLAQRYTICLLQGQGSSRFHQDNGTTLVQSIVAGAAQTRNYLVALFNSANSDAIDAVISDSSVDDPEDEQLESAELEDVSIDYATAKAIMRVNLTSRSGDTYTFVTPAI